MDKPKRIVAGNTGCGVSIEYIDLRQVIRVTSWYDNNYAGAEREIPLAEFLRELGISLRDCKTALEERGDG